MSNRAPKGSSLDTPELTALKEILSPLSVDRFLAETFGRHPLHLAGQPGRFRHLLDWDGLANLLETHHLAPPRLQIVKEGETIAAERYLRSISEGIERIDGGALPSCSIPAPPRSSIISTTCCPQLGRLPMPSATVSAPAPQSIFTPAGARSRGSTPIGIITTFSSFSLPGANGGPSTSRPDPIRCAATLSSPHPGRGSRTRRNTGRRRPALSSARVDPCADPFGAFAAPYYRNRSPNWSWFSGVARRATRG